MKKDWKNDLFTIFNNFKNKNIWLPKIEKDLQEIRIEKEEILDVEIKKKKKKYISLKNLKRFKIEGSNNNRIREEHGESLRKMRTERWQKIKASKENKVCLCGPEMSNHTGINIKKMDNQSDIINFTLRRKLN